MSLAKIPVIIIVAAGFKAMLTPPQPPPPEDEALPSTAVDIRSVRYPRLFITRAVQLIVAGLETATILSTSFPEHPLSQKFLDIVTLKGAIPQNLRLTPLTAAGACLLLFGAGLRLNTYTHLGRFFTFDMSIQKDHKLITSGPYSIVRHPSYTGLLLANVGWVLWTFGRGSYVREMGVLATVWGQVGLGLFVLGGIVPPSVVTLGRMGREDEALKKKFGKEWEEWRAKVRWAVIPGVY